jgi:type II secretion system protein I
MPTRRSRTGEPGAGEARTDEDGFTLLEVLVSLAILSVSLAALMGAFSLCLNRARQTEDEMTARVFAQALVAQANAVADPAPGARSGATGGYRWRLALTPYGQGGGIQTSGMALAAVDATVSWRGDGGMRSLTLHSLRAVPWSQTP